MRGDDDLAITLLHTADWHLGKRFPSFPADQERRLMRARLEVLDRVFGEAQAHQVHAVLCAGDLFDDPKPPREWWEPLVQKLARTPAERPIFLLPGNHDPLMPGTVWHASYGFRDRLPPHVHVIDRPISMPLADGVTLHAAPCTSQAGQEDLALSLPDRRPGDESIRIGLVHGTTFDLRGHETNFPISRDAAKKRGLDYLAIGDTHSFRVVQKDGDGGYVVYPGAPEPTNFGEDQPGNVALVFIKRSRKVRVEPRPVAFWRWEEAEVRSLDQLRQLAARTDLAQRVMRLVVRASLDAREHEEAERILQQLAGTEAVQPKVGILQLDRRDLSLDTSDIEAVFASMPEGLRAAARALKAREVGPEAEAARRALYHLYQLAKKVA